MNAPMISQTTFRALDPSGFEKPKPRDVGPAPMLDWIKIDRLMVDDRYQREIGQRGRKNIAAIAAVFDWSKFSPVIVAPIAGGQFAIIDGQHRSTAALLAGFESVPCQIVQADVTRQAQAFAAVNGAVTRISTMQMFWSRVHANDATALHTVDVCRRADVVMLRYPKPADKIARNETMCLARIEALVKTGPDAAVITGLQCISECGGDDGYPGLLNQTWISAFVDVMAAEPGWREAGSRLFEALDTVDFFDVDERCATEARRRKLPKATILRSHIVTHLASALGGGGALPMRRPPHDPIRLNGSHGPAARTAGQPRLLSHAALGDSGACPPCAPRRLPRPRDQNRS